MGTSINGPWLPLLLYPFGSPKISPFSQPRRNVHAVHQATRCCRHQSTRSLPAERQHLSAKWSDLALKYTEIMGVKQCHKSPMTGIGNHTTDKNGDDWGWFIIVYINGELGDGFLLFYKHYNQSSWD